ncbi:MAG: T9SS type A sorting domain-containing protein, partial [candidate division Zixibacteria bacterium]|nr:T9SS type A sorting domain-containing protein [candidate division Zixibacteria bacterium]
WDSSEVAFAIVVGDDEIELYENAQRARERFDLATSVEDDHLATLPGTAQLHQNYPNPFNPTTTISFSLSRTTDVSLTVYNALGQKVKQLACARLPAGIHACEWDGSSDGGGSVASGVYFYRLQTGETSHSRKMLLLK